MQVSDALLKLHVPSAGYLKDVGEPCRWPKQRTVLNAKC